VKNTGDGFLAEFVSVIDGVRCAVEIQRGMADRELEMSEDMRIRFRIGINLGDVIVEEHDIFGDGVNVAARLGNHRDRWPDPARHVVKDPTAIQPTPGPKKPLTTMSGRTLWVVPGKLSRPGPAQA
jgi:class 3 adenylate cyclase